ncbi:hypothetical protein MRX96_059826 [Rhipicephalus microplus]
MRNITEARGGVFHLVTLGHSSLDINTCRGEQRDCPKRRREIENEPTGAHVSATTGAEATGCGGNTARPYGSTQRGFIVMVPLRAVCVRIGF